MQRWVMPQTAPHRALVKASYALQAHPKPAVHFESNISKLHSACTCHYCARSFSPHPPLLSLVMQHHLSTVADPPPACSAKPPFVRDTAPAARGTAPAAASAMAAARECATTLHGGAPGPNSAGGGSGSASWQLLASVAASSLLGGAAVTGCTIAAGEALGEPALAHWRQVQGREGGRSPGTPQSCS